MRICVLLLCSIHSIFLSEAERNSVGDDLIPLLSMEIRLISGRDGELFSHLIR